MPKSTSIFDTTKFINPSQLGGIEPYVIDDGPARSVRALCVNTAAGLRYRVLVDRGLDIDQAFFNQLSLVFLTHQGPSRPERARDIGIRWLGGFPGGLLTSCGPFNIGPPVTDAGEELGVHGPHSNTPAAIESIIQPDPHAGQLQMSVTANLRYGKLFGPCLNLRRTITSTLGSNSIHFTDEFFNAANTDVPHAWLLHINFGYPLVDRGAELCYNSPKVQGVPWGGSEEYFRSANYKRIPSPLSKHSGGNEYVGYLFPKPHDRAGNTTVAIVNGKLSLAVAIHYNTKQFPRCVNWQHFGKYEYVTALEPANGSVEGRDKDRARNLLDFIKAGDRKKYNYTIEVITGRKALAALLALNH